METNNNLEFVEDQIDPQHKSKRFILAMLAIFVLFLIGICCYALGLFEKSEAKKDENSLDLAVTAAKEKELKDKQINFSQSDNRQIASVQGAEDFETITGSQAAERTGSNEDLTREDFEEVATSKKPAVPHRRVTNKDRVNTKLQSKIAVGNIQNQKLMREDNHLYRQTREEAEEARIEAEDRRNNQRQQDLILSQLEKANNNPNYGKPVQEFQNTTVSDPRPKIKKVSYSPQDPEKSIIAPAVGTNTTGQFWSKQTGFYNLNSTVSKQSYSGKRGIMAVVHGNAEGITIATGQEVKIRLLEPLRIIEGKSSITIPIGTLISTVAKIGNDRLFLNVNSFYYADQMHDLNIAIFDIDGREGLNVPSLLGAKNQNQYVNNLTQPITGGNYFAPTGTVAQQVGSSIAVNLAQNAIQSVGQVVRKKTRITKVQVRSNYKIILFNNSNSNSKQQDDEQIED